MTFILKSCSCGGDETFSADCDCSLYFVNFRREVYRILKEEGILLPRYAVLNRDPDKPEGNTLENLL